MTPEPEPLVDIVCEDERWNALNLEELAETVARATLAEVDLDPALHEISLLACDDARIAELNQSFRGKDAATNVLSWPAAATPSDDLSRRFLGDVALAYETCAREATDAGAALSDHAAHLLAHGVLHLLGHDHIEDAEAQRMEALETKVLARLGLPNPYSG